MALQFDKLYATRNPQQEVSHDVTQENSQGLPAKDKMEFVTHPLPLKTAPSAIVLPT